MPPDTARPKEARAGGRVTRRSMSWKAVAAKLDGEIAAGKYRETMRLPAETVLARALGVSRHTLRRAIAALEVRGLLYCVPHKGVFLAPLRLSFPLSAKTHFADAVTPTGLTPSGQLISQQRCIPPPEIARQLRIAKRSEVIELQVVRAANGKPLSYATIWLPAERFGRIGDLFASVGELHEALNLHGVPEFRRSELRVMARTALEVERNVLGLETGGVVLVVESTSQDPTGEPTHLSLFRFGAERVELAIEL
jgi:GntR family phosphonate transport system transcriptional regulator